MNEIIQNEDGSVNFVYENFTVVSFYPSAEVLETLRNEDNE